MAARDKKRRTKISFDCRGRSNVSGLSSLWGKRLLETWWNSPHRSSGSLHFSRPFTAVRNWLQWSPTASSSMASVTELQRPRPCAPTVPKTSETAMIPITYLSLGGQGDRREPKNTCDFDCAAYDIVLKNPSYTGHLTGMVLRIGSCVLCRDKSQTFWAYPMISYDAHSVQVASRMLWASEARSPSATSHHVQGHWCSKRTSRKSQSNAANRVLGTVGRALEWCPWGRWRTKAFLFWTLALILKFVGNAEHAWTCSAFGVGLQGRKEYRTEPRRKEISDVPKPSSVEM